MIKKVKVSSGTASVLGLNKLKPKAPPTTAYLMLGEKCTNNCKFCTQSSLSTSSESLLSRVDWHNYDIDDILEQTNRAFNENTLKRMCFQIVDSPSSVETTLEMIRNVSATSKIPICASSTVKNAEQARTLFDNGLDKLCVALDAVTEKVYTQTKGTNFDQKLNFIIELSTLFPGKITTHVIAGLGETEYEMAKTLSLLSSHKITIALFAFTPIKGTPMENHPKPSLDSYRRIQITNYLLQNSQISFDDIQFEDTKIKGFSATQTLRVLETLKSSNGKPFMTSGCPDCNRPYYNDTPTEIPYNYPYQPNTEEITNAINTSKLFAIPHTH